MRTNILCERTKYIEAALKRKSGINESGAGSYNEQCFLLRHLFILKQSHTIKDDLNENTNLLLYRNKEHKVSNF
jgi:hypothetical protein